MASLTDIKTGRVVKVQGGSLSGCVEPVQPQASKKTCDADQIKKPYQWFGFGKNIFSG